jgi:hypothetical protein
MQSPPAESPSRRVCDAFVVGLAIWTLLTNAAVWLGAGLDALIAAAGVAAVAGGGAAFWRSRRRAQTEPGAAPETAANEAEPDDLAPAWRVGLLAAGGLAAVLHATAGALHAAWALVLIGSGALLLRQLGRAPAAPAPRRSSTSEVALFGMAACMALLTAVAHRGDADDAFYVNLLVAAIDDPSAPLLAGDTLHGVPGVSMSLPVFKVLSIQMLGASIARLTGASGLGVAHLLFPPLFAFLMTLAYAQLLRWLVPGRWLAALACSAAFLLTVGEGSLGYGDFALLRMQQGKSMMLHVALPLIASYGIQLARAPSARRWWMLAAAQIAAVGLSTTALWLAPVVATLGVVSATALPLAADRRAALRGGLRTVALGVASSFYPLGLALAMRAETARLFKDAVYAMEALSWSGDQLFVWALESVMGGGVWASLFFLAILAAGTLTTSPLGQRFVATYAFAFVLLFWNPWAAPLVARNVSGPDTYFRVFWILPLPILVGMALSAPLEIGRIARPIPRAAAIAVVVLLCGVALVLAPATPTLSRTNGVALHAPGYKVPAEGFEAAKEIARLAPGRPKVLAPIAVARWLPLLPEHPYPLVVRELNLDILHPHLGGAELDRRRLLVHLVGGELRVPSGGDLLAAAIVEYPLEVVSLGGRALAWPEVRAVLLASPLEVRYRTPDFEIWSRSVAPGSDSAVTRSDGPEDPPETPAAQSE